MKNINDTSKNDNTSSGSTNEKRLDADLAGEAAADALIYLKNRWEMSGSEIGNILHLAHSTINKWIRDNQVPINRKALHPDVQALIHLIAIHRSLEAMFSEPRHQLDWLNTHHPKLNAVPMKILSESIEGLILIRQYLDYVRGRGA